MKIDLDKPKNNNSDCSEIGTISKELKDFRSKFDIAKIMQAFPDTPVTVETGRFYPYIKIKSCNVCPRIFEYKTTDEIIEHIHKELNQEK